MPQEFCVAVTRRLARPLAAAAAAETVSAFAELPLAQIYSESIVSAIYRSRDDQLLFWDALKAQAAIESHANTL